jgi:hypothetical protein
MIRLTVFSVVQATQNDSEVKVNVFGGDSIGNYDKKKFA